MTSTSPDRRASDFRGRVRGSGLVAVQDVVCPGNAAQPTEWLDLERDAPGHRFDDEAGLRDGGVCVGAEGAPSGRGLRVLGGELASLDGAVESVAAAPGLLGGPVELRLLDVAAGQIGRAHV